MESSSETRYRFRAGLPAFEQDREFVLTAGADWHPFLMMESVRHGGPRFVCIEISAIAPDFRLELEAEDAAMIDTEPRAVSAKLDVLRLVAIVAALEDGTLTANLAAPVVLNPETACGVQSIQAGSAYSPVTVIGLGRERLAC